MPRTDGRAGTWALTHSSSLVLHLVRGLAAQAVVVGHGLGFFGISERYDVIQNSAVAVFFVLSGFVIPYSSLAKASRDPGYGFAHFFVDRFSRIYMGLAPALVFVLAIDLLSVSLFGPGYRYGGALNAMTFVGNLLMLQEYPVAPVITSFGSARPLWTIAVEWWIYLFFGWTVLRHRWRLERPALYWLGAAVLFVVPSFDWVTGRGHGLSMVWFMGTLIYLLIPRAPRLSSRLLWVLVIVVASMAGVRLYLAGTAYDQIYVGLFALGLYLTLCVSQREGIRFPRSLATAITFNAEFSYTLYLVHYSVLAFLVLWLGPGLGNLAIGFVASSVVAVVLYLAFERHYKRFGALLLRRAVPWRP